MEHQGSSKVFKAPAHKVANRQVDADNQLMRLGGGTDELRKGLKRDTANINCKQTSAADMYLMADINMLHRRIRDEYPLYEKDGSFNRAIEDVSGSPKKYTDYLKTKGVSGAQASHLQSLV